LDIKWRSFDGSICSGWGREDRADEKGQGKEREERYEPHIERRSRAEVVRRRALEVIVTEASVRGKGRNGGIFFGRACPRLLQVYDLLTASFTFRPREIA
jgi:hypothetical protein